jgi:hypothetical protein
MPASTLSGRSVALLRVQLDNCTPSEGQLILTETAQEPLFCLLVFRIWNGPGSMLVPKFRRFVNRERIDGSAIPNAVNYPLVLWFIGAMLSLC